LREFEVILSRDEETMEHLRKCRGSFADKRPIEEKDLSR
jgi:hypothetical protein